MRTILYAISLFMLISCDRGISEADIKHLNGLWEIEMVKLEDGTEKEYQMSEIIDRFEIAGSEGIRRKVRVQFDGKYPDAGAAEKIKVLTQDESTFLQYKTDYTTWSEEILELSSEKLVLKNSQDTEYHYKRHQPFSLK